MADFTRNLVLWKKSHLPDDWTLYQAMAFTDWLRRNGQRLDDSSMAGTKDDSAEKANEISAEIEKLQLTGETKDAVIKQRVNQGVFRERLLSRYEHCVLCQVNEPQLLIASHIKPWNESTPEERLDRDNGFLMCPNHDKVFDRGFISFADDGRILISPELSETNRMFLNLNEDMHMQLLEGNRKYLEYHREFLFKG